MKYVLLLCDSDRSTYTHQTPAETQKTYGALMTWWHEKEKQKIILGGEQLEGPDKATTVRSIGGKSVVTDGPFIEAKESIGGYALVDVPDLDAAIGLAKEWNGLLPGSTVEVRPLHQGEGM